MRRIRTVVFLVFYCHLAVFSQSDSLFKGKFVNKEYDVYLVINFHDKDVKVPGQEIFGLLPGYLGSGGDGRKWLVTDAQCKDQKEALLEISNDYGSEDLTAVIKVKNDSTFVLKQLEGSRIRIAVNRKWVKLPSELSFTRQ